MTYIKLAAWCVCGMDLVQGNGAKQNGSQSVELFYYKNNFIRTTRLKFAQSIRTS